MAEQNALFDVERTWRVGELSARLAKVVASAFPAEVWVQGEVDGHRPANAAGHVYFNLCERNSRRGPTSTISVALFRAQRELVDRSLHDWPDFRLTDGLEVRIRARVQYSYNRLQLVMSAIDPVHTLGRLAADRERVLRALAADGLVGANAALPLAPAPLDIALVTSAGSAACEDVLHELQASGFGFRVSLFDARVQGVGADTSVTRALAMAARRRPDAILLVRGGGARTDLATFDAEKLARAVATCTAPVVTGIGHEIDSSVVDEVCHTACKTPTAAAGLLVGRVASALAGVDAAAAAVIHHGRRATADAGSTVDSRARQIGDLAASRLASERQRLHAGRLRLEPARLAGGLRRHEAMLQRAAASLRRASASGAAAASSRIDLLAARTEAADPARILARGFTITRSADGELIRHSRQLSPGDQLVTTFDDGTAASAVVRVGDEREG